MKSGASTHFFTSQTPCTHCRTYAKRAGMDRKALMEQVERRAFEARVTLHSLCASAGLSGTIAARWQKGDAIPSLPTIGKLEGEIAKVEAERAAA